MKSAENKILNDIIHLASSNFFKHFISLLTAFIRPKWLSPEHFGIWSLLNTIPNYMAYFDFGVRRAMRYQISSHQHNPEKLAIIQGTSFWSTAIMTLILSLGVIAYALIADITQEMKISLFLVLLIVLLGVYFEQRFNEMRGYQEFRLISKMVYLRYTLTSILTILFIYLWGIYGAFSAIVIALLISNLYILRHGTQVRYTHFDWQALIQLIRFGLPLMMMSITEILLRMIDKWLIAAFLGTQALGYYSIGAMILGPLLNIPGVSRDVTESSLLKESSNGREDEKAQILERYLVTPLLMTCSLTMPILIGIAIFAVPAFIQLLLPDYTAGIQAVQILLLGSFFLALTFPIRGVVIANDWQTPVALLTFIPIIFSIAINIYLIKKGYGIEGVAFGTSLSFVLLATCLLTYVLIRQRAHLKYSIKKLFLSAVIFPLICSLLYFIEFKIPFYQQTHWAIDGIPYDLDLLFDQIIKCLMFLMIYLPLPLILWKKGLFSMKKTTVSES